MSKIGVSTLPKYFCTFYVLKEIVHVLVVSVWFLAELFRGMLFKWKGENKKSHQK